MENPMIDRLQIFQLEHKSREIRKSLKQPLTFLASDTIHPLLTAFLKRITIVVISYRFASIVYHNPDTHFHEEGGCCQFGLIFSTFCLRRDLLSQLGVKGLEINNIYVCLLYLEYFVMNSTAAIWSCPRFGLSSFGCCALRGIPLEWHTRTNSLEILRFADKTRRQFRVKVNGQSFNTIHSVNFKWDHLESPKV